MMTGELEKRWQRAPPFFVFGRGISFGHSPAGAQMNSGCAGKAVIWGSDIG
ncbi:MAG: hypothetical protein WDA25_11485 [Paracoccaceae bacterium]